MKRAVLLLFIFIIGLAAFLASHGVIPVVPEDSAVVSFLNTLFENAATIALLVVALVLFAILLYSRQVERLYRRFWNSVSGRAADKKRMENMPLSRRCIRS